MIVVDRQRASVMVLALSSPTAEHEARVVTFDARPAKAVEQVAPFVSVLTLGPARSGRPRGDDRQAGTGPS